jgi:hypothetical protein
MYNLDREQVRDCLTSFGLYLIHENLIKDTVEEPNDLRAISELVDDFLDRAQGIRA